MPTADKLTMFQMAVGDMPKAKEFYSDHLGLKVAKDYRQDEDHWWVSLDGAQGGATITLTTYKSNMKPGNLVLYFSTSDVTANHQALAKQGVKVGDIQNDLYGPGSGVKFFQVEDPDHNLVHVWQA
ncbi:MAG TPA: VOC family protein [Candidatus Saccharimonadia bacterium]|jgi:predicted enzyme related to lactoylglutathione lyase